MTSHLHLMNAGKQLALEAEADVLGVLSQTLRQHSALLELTDIDVAVRILPWGLPETGVHGYAPTAHYIELTLNPHNPNFAQKWRTEVAATLAHEMHHCRRWRSAGYGKTLFEVLVTEGLAQHYEKSERGGQAAFYSSIASELAPLWQRAKALLDLKTYNHRAWFFGDEAEGLPRWAGYALGYNLVARFLNVAGGDALSHADTPAEAFRAFLP